MQHGLDLTLDLLSTTGNEAAVELLLYTLDSPHELAQQRALQSLLKRRSPAGLREVISRWHQFSPPVRTAAKPYGGRLSGAIRDAVLGSEEQLRANGCDAAQDLAEYDIMPALVNVAESGEASHADRAAQALLQLSQLLHDDLSRPRDWRQRPDPQRANAHVTSALEVAARKFPKHGRKEILTAFLTLAGRDNATLMNILRDPLDGAHTAVVEQLVHSPRASIIKLATGFLNDMRAPQAALGVLARRQDDAFVQEFLRAVGPDPSSAVKGNLKRMTKIRWLQQSVASLALVDEDAQFAGAQATVHCGIPLNDKLRVLKELLAHGKPSGRLAAAEALAKFKGVEANRLVMKALRDADVRVQAAGLRQLRERGLPGTMATLIEALDSEHELLREAASQSLGEFDFPRYMNAFEGMTEEVRRSTGRLVCKVDLRAAQLLCDELQSASRSRRLRAIEVAQTLGMIADCQDAFHKLLGDEDHLVRMEAAAALAHCPTNDTRLALRAATLDSSTAVRSAAQRALDDMVVAGSQPAEPIDVAAICSPDEVARPSAGGASW